MWATDHSSQPPWLGTLMDQGGDAVAVIGPDGTILYANVAAHALLTVGAGALAGTNAFDLVHPEDWERVAVNLDGMVAGARPRPGLIRLRRHDGSVDDDLGHVVGDHTIMVCARRLEQLVRPGDVVARLGGDELAMARPGVDRGQLEDLAARIVDALGQPFRVGPHDLDVGASVGCVLAGPGDAPDAVVAAADAALYEAKGSGRRTWRRAPGVAPRAGRVRRLPFPGAATA